MTSKRRSASPPDRWCGALRSGFPLTVAVVLFFGVGASACGSDPGEAGPDTGDVGIPDAEPLPENACGGDDDLVFDAQPAAPGEPCGPCSEGILVCDGPDELRCAGDTPQNECGGCAPLPGQAGDVCGPCKSGTWQCNDQGGMECVDAAERNACGGCTELDGLPASPCQTDDGGDGVWTCTGPDEIRCRPPGDNPCGGDFELPYVPGTPCGACDGGTWQCDGPDDVVCDDPHFGVNECGGCTTLYGIPGDECGICGGQWVCDGDEALRCDDPPLNACAGCGDIDGGAPGTSCAGDAVYACADAQTTSCPDEPTNACGGTEALDADVGDACGDCGDGIVVCAAPDQVACLGDRTQNACGGCASLKDRPGNICGPGQVWACDGADDVVCVADDEAPPPPPQHLSATDATDEEYVLLSWNPSALATGYRVYRDDEFVDEVPHTDDASMTFDDEDATAGDVPTEPAITDVVDTPHHVRVEFDAASVDEGPWHTYHVVAVNDAGESAPSNGALGRRDAQPISDYEIRADDGDWNPVSHLSELAHEDDGADAPTIDVDDGAASAGDGTSTDHVDLHVADVAVYDGAPRDYRVRALNASGASEPSDPETGHRPAEELEFLWESSPDGSPSSYDPVAAQDVITPDHQDTSAPDDGTPLYYRVHISAEGADDVTVDAGTGFRASLPDVLTDEASAIEMESATLHGELLSLGAPEATDYGFCVGTSPAPDDCDSAGTPAVGSFSMDIDDLSPGITYFVRAYVTNAAGTVYGDDYHFATDMDPVDWAQSSTGNHHTCGVGTEGSLWCWGDGGSGRLGVGDDDDRAWPARVGADSDWSTVSAGNLHSCAIRDDGTLWCWGAGGAGRLGLGDEENHDTPKQVGDDDDWIAVEAGLSHTCGIRDGGRLYCWGSGAFGRLGLGDTDDRFSPDQVGSDDDWIDVSSMTSHTCGLRSDGSGWCWGLGSSGRLGNGDDVDHHTPQQVLGDSDWEAISVGHTHTCGVRDDDSLWCWGSGLNGKLGLGDTSNRDTPQQVGSASDWSAVAAGRDHSCAVRSGGAIWCWGDGDDGRLGLGHSLDFYTPQQVTSPQNAADIEAGHDHTCARTDDDRLWCWGSQESGQPGQGEFYESYTTQPVPLDADRSFSKIRAGERYGVGIATDGTVWSWGRDPDGVLGLGGVEKVPLPNQIGDSDQWSDLADIENVSHVCAIGDDGSLWCWGYGGSGRLGLGDSDSRDIPAAVEGDDWSVVSTGRVHTCGIRDDGTLWCWGSGWGGRLGMGNNVSHFAPEQVGTATDWETVSAGGGNHTCAIRNGGELWCWGMGFDGALGQGDTEDYDTPQQVGDDADWSDVSAGSAYTCAIRDDGSLWCWGGGQAGRLGLGDTDDRTTPVQVGADSDWASVSTGSVHTCGVRDDATLWCWGGGSQGKLGLGDTDRRHTPEQVGDDADWASVSAGMNHTHAIRTSGSAWAWGANAGGGGGFSGPSNLSGQLGDGRAWKDEPVEVFAP